MALFRSIDRPRRQRKKLDKDRAVRRAGRTKRTPHNLEGKAWKLDSRRHLERPSLLLGEVEPIVTANKKRKALRAADPGKPKREATGDMLFIRNRPMYERIVHMIAANESSCQIHRLTKVDRLVIEAVRAREKVTIEQERAYILETVRKGARLYAEKLVDMALSEDGGGMRPRDITIALAVLADKMLLLSGEATSISQQTVTHQINHTAWNDILDAVEIKPVEGSDVPVAASETPALPERQGEAPGANGTGTKEEAASDLSKTACI